MFIKFYLSIFLLFVYQTFAHPFKYVAGNSEAFLSKTNKFNFDDLKTLIVFGDSYSTASTNFEDMTYTGKNRSLGKNWPLKLIDKKDIKMFNFAIPASTVNQDIVESKSHTDLFDEYNIYFDKMTEKKPFADQWESSTTLFGIWIGSVDVIRIKKNQDFEKMTKEILADMFKNVENLYKTGARNFLILDIFQLDDTPYNKSGKVDFLKDDITYYNNLLKKNVEKFFKSKKDVNIFYYDINSLVTDIISNCKDYGLDNCVDAYNLNKDKDVKGFLWSDFTHTTYTANAIFTENIETLLKTKN